MIVYKTTNLINNKIYVGQDSKNNPNYFGSGKYIWSAIKKHGKENFIKEILCECSCKEELDEMEKYWIKELDCKVPNGYNIADGGEGHHGPHREETKQKLRKPHGPMSEETKQKLRKPKLEEVKLKMRKPKGPMSEEHKKNHKLSLNSPKVKEKQKRPRGPYSEERKQNMKIAQNRPEVLEKHRKPASEETKKNMRIAQNRPDRLEKNKQSRSEEGRKNIKLANNRPERLEIARKPRGPMSEKGKQNMKSGQQKRRERENITKQIEV